MTREEALAFIARYRAINAYEIEELRATSLALKLEQTAALMASVQQMGWKQKLDEEEAEVRERWLRLKREYLRG
ncbi:MAG TPA: hypothetical protein VNO70_08800 [Blastocatellia bacterium]|nr:hypothetical protein [Blastocatellia bacterium]